MRITSITQDYNQQNFKGRLVNKKNLLASAALLHGASYPALISNNFQGWTGFNIAATIMTATACMFKEKPLSLAPNIKFIRANKIEEAKEFAEKNFKIKNFKISDLNTANWVNEGLSVLNNKFKGKVYMPSTIEYKRCDKNSLGGCYIPLHDKLIINKPDEEFINIYLDIILEIAKNEKIDKFKLGTTFKQFLEDCKNHKKFNTIEKWSLIFDIQKALEIIKKSKSDIETLSRSVEESDKDIFGPIYTGRFGVLFHEMGHVFHHKSSNLLFQKKQIFDKGKKDLLIADYPNSSYYEFIAEIFAGALNGNRYPQKILNLYSKLTSAKLLQN